MHQAEFIVGKIKGVICMRQEAHVHSQLLIALKTHGGAPVLGKCCHSRMGPPSLPEITSYKSWGKACEVTIPLYKAVATEP